MHTTESITEQIITLAADLLARDRDQIHITDNIYALGFDSLDYVEYIRDIEEAFDVCVPDEDAEQWEKLIDVLDWLVEKLGVEAV